MAGLCLLLGGGWLSFRGQSFESTGHYFVGELAGEMAVSFLLRSADEHRQVEGSLSDLREWSRIEGSKESPWFQGVSRSRSGEGYETNATFRARIQSDTLAGELFRSDTTRAFSLPLVGTERNLHHSLDFRVGKYGCKREASVRIPQLESRMRSIEAVNALFRSQADQEIATFFEDYWSVLKDSVRLPGASFNWSLDTTYRLHVLEPNLVSAWAEHYSYTGGAHGNTSHTGLNISWSDDGTVRIYDLEDLFPNIDEAIKLTSIACLESLEEQGAAEVVGGRVSSFDREDLRTFVMDRHGILFVFAPYHVGPYVQGAFQVRVPADVLSPLLGNDSLSTAVKQLWNGGSKNL